MIDILKNISDDIGLCIAEHYADIGAMMDLKRKFKQQEIKQYADYFIRIDLADIEILGEERNDHEKRLSDLRRARQDRAGNGNGDQVSERARVYVNAEFWYPDPGQAHGGLPGRGVDNDLGVHKERQDAVSTDANGGVHQAEMFPPVVQLRGSHSPISPAISDGAPPVPAPGIEGKRDGLA